MVVNSLTRGGVRGSTDPELARPLIGLGTITRLFLLPQATSTKLQQVDALTEIRLWQAALAHQCDGLYVATIGDQSVHLCSRLGRQPAPQRIIHAHIEPAEQPMPGRGGSVRESDTSMNR